MPKSAHEEIENWGRMLTSNNSIIENQQDQLKLLSGKKGQLENKKRDNINLKSHVKNKGFEIGKTKRAFEEDKSSQLKAAQAELQLALKEESCLKETLNLPSKATKMQVRERIYQLKETSANKSKELDEAFQKLINAQRKIGSLEQEVYTLKGVINRLALQLYQKEHRPFEQPALPARPARLVRKKDTPSRPWVHAKTVRREPEHMAPPTPPLPRVTPATVHIPRDLYCLLCRREFDITKDSTCKSHYLPIRCSRWSCCGEDRHNLHELGCLTLPHLFLQKNPEATYLTIDGTNSIRVY